MTNFLFHGLDVLARLNVQPAELRKKYGFQNFNSGKAAALRFYSAHVKFNHRRPAGHEPASWLPGLLALPGSHGGTLSRSQRAHASVLCTPVKALP